MKRVIGIGGIFFKSKDPKALSEWYTKHLGIANEGWGAQFFFDQVAPQLKDGYQLWSPFSDTTTYFEPSTQTFMVNFIVADLDALLDALRAEGVNVVDKKEEGDFGKFGWCFDPEGNKVELWEPGGKGE